MNVHHHCIFFSPALWALDASHMRKGRRRSHWYIRKTKTAQLRSLAVKKKKITCCTFKYSEMFTCGSSNARPAICIAGIKLMEGKKELCLAFSLSTGTKWIVLGAVYIESLITLNGTLVYPVGIEPTYTEQVNCIFKHQVTTWCWSVVLPGYSHPSPLPPNTLLPCITLLQSPRGGICLDQFPGA